MKEKGRKRKREREIFVPYH
uniref:Uncharacterized protein n=1 Tax=Wuchereria bancrofti TaxID=6293 RepID=A0AAF5RSY2_WUCBA